MRYFVGAVLVMLVLGAFIAPPYRYTAEEQARLTQPDHPSMWDFVAWPARVYENWRNCGTIRYCRETRCAALQGGCQPPPWSAHTQFAPPRIEGESAAAWQSRVHEWCRASKRDYARWLERKKTAEARCELVQSGGWRPKKGASKPVKTKPSGTQIDTSNLVDCSVLGHRPKSVADYEAHCR